METNINKVFENFNIDVDGLKDHKVKEAILLLFNLIEKLSSTNKELQTENQKLRDEIYLLKGEQGKPEIKPNKNKKDDEGPISSEKDRKGNGKQKKKKSKSKLEKIKINRSQVCAVDREILPNDAKFKGYDIVVVQDIKIATDNVEFKKEVFHSPSLKKTYRGQLPLGYEGEFGPTVKALTIIMKYVCNVSEPKIFDFFKNFNIHISKSTISRILIKDKETFHDEKKAIFKAGMESTNYQQIDDTRARVNGENYYTHVMCNKNYTAYFTKKRKDRLTIIDILRGPTERSYCFNEETFSLLEQLKVSKKMINELKSFERDKKFSHEEVEHLLANRLPKIGKVQKVRVLEAAAIASYHMETGFPVVKVLHCDDAPQFKVITENLSLCWVHDGRHYKKLRPIVPYHKKLVDYFLTDYWAYYKRLLKFKEGPSAEFAGELSKEFDELFSRKTGYDELDERIKKSYSKKGHLLMVFRFPEIPLHNNAAELGVRAQVRRRDVSLQTKTDEGTDSNDTFLTIVQTATKLKINAFTYIFDRVSKKFNLPSLAELIRGKAAMSQIEFSGCE